MRPIHLAAAIAALLAMASGAQAAPFKCQGPDGKFVFSDQRCPPTDEERIKELEAILRKADATPEQKASAQGQIDTIRSRAKDEAEKKVGEKAGEKKPKLEKK